MKVSFETAKLAKEKGFNLLTNDYYYEHDNKVHSDNGDGDNEFICLNHNKYEGYYSAPYQSSLQKWLRDLPTPIIVTPTTDFVAWEVEILHADGGKHIIERNDEDKWFNSYEEALKFGLIHALNLIK